MELRTGKSHPFHQSQPIAACAQCGVMLFAPEWTEYLDERRVRHLWNCTSCGYAFETFVRYPAPAGTTD